MSVMIPRSQPFFHFLAGIVLDRLAHRLILAGFLGTQPVMHGPVLTAARWCMAS